MNRRQLLGAGGALALSGLFAEVIAEETMKDIAALKPGEFSWHPERQPTGPVAVVVSLPQQRVHVYRNGIRIAVSTCSTGKPGHSTPTGVFVVLQKDKNHRSSTYNDAPMPNMNRLTWSGIALHAGNLPGYPASHGCVRLPLAFSEKLFTITHLGTPVIIAGAHSDPWELTHPGMVLGNYAEQEFRTVEQSLDGKKQPVDWTATETAPVVSVIASYADRSVILVENGDVIAESKLLLAEDKPLGSHVFVLGGASSDVQGMRWLAITHSAQAKSDSTPEVSALQRLKADQAFIDKVTARMHPGMTAILTDAPLHPEMRSGKDFVIMS